MRFPSARSPNAASTSATHRQAPAEPQPCKRRLPARVGVLTHRTKQPRAGSPWPQAMTSMPAPDCGCADRVWRAPPVSSGIPAWIISTAGSGNLFRIVSARISITFNSGHSRASLLDPVVNPGLSSAARISQGERSMEITRNSIHQQRSHIDSIRTTPHGAGNSVRSLMARIYPIRCLPATCGKRQNHAAGEHPLPDTLA